MYICMALSHWRVLLEQTLYCARLFALAQTGNRSAARSDAATGEVVGPLVHVHLHGLEPLARVARADAVLRASLRVGKDWKQKRRQIGCCNRGSSRTPRSCTSAWP